jgi:hypothetical protein
MTFPSDLWDPLARNSDPATSHSAAASIRGKTEGIERLIVATLRRLGSCTTGEIQEHLVLEGLIGPTTQINKRMAALRRRGLIQAIGVGTNETTGRAQTLYMAAADAV